jgi:hypothetical protein
LIYDILLLLIYNVKSSIQVSAGFLIEYLENMYKEESIDLGSFANYNSGSSLGFKSLNTSNDISAANNINKFLSYNNVWSIEKVTSEFKTIHANKVAHT